MSYDSWKTRSPDYGDDMANEAECEAWLDAEGERVLLNQLHDMHEDHVMPTLEDTLARSGDAY